MRLIAHRENRFQSVLFPISGRKNPRECQKCANGRVINNSRDATVRAGKRASTRELLSPPRICPLRNKQRFLLFASNGDSYLYRDFRDSRHFFSQLQAVTWDVGKCVETGKERKRTKIVETRTRESTINYLLGLPFVSFKRQTRYRSI